MHHAIALLLKRMCMTYVVRQCRMYVTEEGFLLDVFVNVLYSILLNSCSVYHNKCLCSDL